MKHRLSIRLCTLFLACALPALSSAAEVYKIGAVFPLTGGLSWLGEYYRKAAELQVAMLNEQGGAAALDARARHARRGLGQLGGEWRIRASQNF